MEESATRQYLTFVLGGERFALESLLVSEVLDMPVDARLDVGRQARAMVQDRFTVKAMQDATLDVYREVLA